jgi:hypothetical protein
MLGGSVYPLIEATISGGRPDYLVFSFPNSSSVRKIDILRKLKQRFGAKKICNIRFRVG